MFNRRLTPIALLIIGLLIVAAIGQNLRQRGNFARVSFQVGDEMSLTFLRQHVRGREACEAAAESIASLMVTNCPLCKVTKQECLRELSSDQTKQFGEEPLPNATTRMRNGVVTYQSADPLVALLSCQATEKRSPLGTANCSPPNTVRPLSEGVRANIEDLEHAFIGLAWSAMGLVAFLALYLAYHWRQRRMANVGPRRPYNTWPAKLTLVAGDAIVIVNAGTKGASVAE